MDCAWKRSKSFPSALNSTSAVLPYLFHLLAPPLQLPCQRKVEISSNSYCLARNAPPPSGFPPFTLPAPSCCKLAWGPHGPLLLNLVMPSRFYFAQWENVPFLIKHSIFLCFLSSSFVYKSMFLAPEYDHCIEVVKD